MKFLGLLFVLLAVLRAQISESLPAALDTRCEPLCEKNRICRPAVINRKVKFHCVDPNTWGMFDLGK
ncbi:hypothetical protein L596_019408 [Steinernema carpocapsae]|uniref:Uncharacterized protein n=1 Tax=Steinernema carpocapsae TaxID=34508 RepID=A0A4V6A0P1_STECR|nr:hypothetical protein L596_019408 [Steinernema carpocapsae]